MRARWAVSVFAALAVFAAVGAYMLMRAMSPQLRLPVAATCLVSDSDASASVSDSDASAAVTSISLAPAQLANAATIAAVGLRRGMPRRAVTVALATAWQESKLENIAGGDRDSIGLFQQRPSQGWGTPAQIADPRYAANAFYTSLLKVRGWQAMRVTDAAQEVQRSAHPEAYEKWAARSDMLARALSGDVTGAVACSLSSEPASRGSAAVELLTASLRLDWGDVRTTGTSDFTGVTLVARDAKVGWQYAHWLVAHAEDRGVKRVRFGDREWTARSGTWGRVTAGPAGSGSSAGVGGGGTPSGGPSQRVAAEVYPH